MAEAAAGVSKGGRRERKTECLVTMVTRPWEVLLLFLPPAARLACTTAKGGGGEMGRMVTRLWIHFLHEVVKEFVPSTLSLSQTHKCGDLNFSESDIATFPLCDKMVHSTTYV